MPGSAPDAWFELVGYEVEATANLYELREAEFTNLRYAAQGRAATNDLAAAAEAGLERDFALAERFNHGVAGGKWAGFQTQPHIDYGDVARYGPNASWQQPELNNVALPDVLFPAVRRIELQPGAELGVAVDGFPGAEVVLRPYRTGPAPYIEVFNRGRDAFDYRIEASEPWITVARPRGRVRDQVRVVVKADWSRAPHGRTQARITVSGARASVVVPVIAEHPVARGLRGFVEAGGYVAMDAEHWVGGGHLAAGRPHRAHRGGHDAVPRDGPAPDAGRHGLPPPGVRGGEPVERRHGDRVGVPVPAQPGPPDGRPALRALLRRRAAADGRHPRGHGSRRRPDEQLVGPQHLGQRERDVDEA